MCNIPGVESQQNEEVVVLAPILENGQCLLVFVRGLLKEILLILGQAREGLFGWFYLGTILGILVPSGGRLTTTILAFFISYIRY